VGGEEIWSTAEAALVAALNTKGWQYQVDEGGGEWRRNQEKNRTSF
jgi:threonyl-tRNA synthetase